jgi:hypothetical protein
MTNKHIELVKKWLADNDSVTQAELEANSYAADAASAAAAYDAYVAASAATATAAAADAAYAPWNTAAKDATAAAADAAYWVKVYEERVGG